MYELWKIIRRNPGFYNTRSAGVVFFGYVTFCILKQALEIKRSGYVKRKIKKNKKELIFILNIISLNKLYRLDSKTTPIFLFFPLNF